jgi:adenylate cyclase
MISGLSISGVCEVVSTFLCGVGSEQLADGGDEGFEGACRRRAKQVFQQILDGLSNVSPLGEVEQKVASRRGWDEFTRLACQTRVEGDVVIRRLLEKAQDIVVLDFDEIKGGTAGEGKELDLAVLFSDIRDFTTLSEKSMPYDVVHMLNRYFTAAAEPVLNNNGFIDKYIGDGILAVFGTRDESPGTACRNAVRAALGMVEAVRRRGPTFEREFNMPLRIGIGIHFGTVILGRVGHPGKRQITVIGDAVINRSISKKTFMRRI